MKTCRLLEVSQIKNLSVKKFDGEKQYVATGDVNESSVVSSTAVTFQSRPSRANLLATKNQVLFAKMKGTNKVLKIDDELSKKIYSTGFCVLEVGGQLFPDYLKVYIMSNYFQKQKDKYSKGATQKAINNEGLKKIVIPLPPLDIQKKIVAVLDKAQAMIDLRKQQIQLLDDLIQSIFYDMFGDPVTNPKGWEKKRLEDSCEIITGNTPSRKDKNNYGDFIEWIKSDNINTPYTYLTKAVEFLSKDGCDKARCVEKNAVLMTCIAGSLSCIGNVAIANRKVSFNQQINAIVPRKYALIFLYSMLRFSKKYIQCSSSNSMKGMLSKGKLSQMDFVVPSIELQNQFAEKVQKIEAQKALMQQSLKEMENNYNSLMQRAFKGELFNRF